MVKRLSLYFIGVLILGLGIVLNTKTGLGVSAINSFPYAISEMAPVTLGNATAILYFLFVVAQLSIHRKLDLKVLLQIPFSYLMGAIIDFYNNALNFTITSLPLALAVLAVAILLTALGAFVVVSLDLIPNPADGIVNSISFLTKREFGKTKLIFDCIMIVATVLVSFFISGSIIGIGIGTVVSALLIGNIIVIYNRYFGSYLATLVVAQQ